MPRRNRLAHFIRALATTYIIALEWPAIRGRRRSIRGRATTFLNDISNSTHGRGLEVVNHLICRLRQKETALYDAERVTRRPNPEGYDQASVGSIVAKLNSHGCAVVRSFVDRTAAESIAEAVRAMPGQCDLNKHRYSDMTEWMNDKSAEPRFHSSGEYLAENLAIVSLARSTFVQDVARDYLGAAPLLASLQSWTTRPPVKQTADTLDAAAMAYHCDSDFFGFLKFFVLLTEVGPTNGPFTFIERSHRGTRHVAGRMPDSEVVGPYDVEFHGTGHPGDLVIVDTKGWHKASPPVEGYRTMLQFVYSTSLFGSPT
jgi:ectoine hydroxylase-related dioxygenase (phytanoyl-CoA dioxygenase family)